MELFDLVLEIVGTCLLIDASVARITCTQQLVLVLVPVIQDLLHLALLRQDLVAEGKHALVAVSADEATPWIPVLDLMDHEAAIGARRE